MIKNDQYFLKLFMLVVALKFLPPIMAILLIFVLLINKIFTQLPSNFSPILNQKY